MRVRVRSAAAAAIRLMGVIVKQDGVGPWIWSGLRGGEGPGDGDSRAGRRGAVGLVGAARRKGGG